MSKKKREQKQYRRKRLKEITAILKKNDLMSGLSPEKVKATIADLGPTYIKLGQIMSMRRDLLPKEYCDVLVELQSSVNPIPFETILEQLEIEYGKDPYEIFESIDEEPLGSASIAQVHRAVLKSGEKVVVKVQRPDIYMTMQEDIDILTRAARLLGKVGPAKKAVQIIDVEAVLNEMWKAAKQEMNFVVEAQNAERFKKFNEHVEYFDSPVIYHEYTTPKVLVMNYIPGITVDQVEELEEAGYDRDALAKQLSENYIKQIITDGFFHADPHPGNIKIHDDKIAWIDLGMMGTLSERDKALFRDAIVAVTTNNVRKLERTFLKLGIHDGSVDEVKLYEQISRMLDEYSTINIDEIQIEKFMNQIIEICTDNNISMPSDITMLFRGVATLESVITNLSPTANAVSLMSSYILSSRGIEHIEKEFKEITKKTIQAGDATLKLPGSLNDFLNLMLKGNAKINIAVTGSEEPLAALAKMVNRLVMGIITAALLIGSSFISTTNMSPKILGIPALGIIGYIVSFGLGFWIVVQMLGQDRTLDKQKKK